MWQTVVIASIATFSLKILGYFLPETLLNQEIARRVIAVLPIGLLSGLIAIQLVTTKTAYVLDGRIAGALAAVTLLLLRAPFIIVITFSALITALGRYYHVWI